MDAEFPSYGNFIDMNTKDSLGWTPFMYTCTKGQQDIVKRGVLLAAVWRSALRLLLTVKRDAVDLAFAIHKTFSLVFSFTLYSLFIKAREIICRA